MTRQKYRDRKPRGGVEKPITREDVERAIRNTRSNKMAARYLGISYGLWVKWSKTYKYDDGTSYYDRHNNQHGKGLRKYASKTLAIADVLNGKIPAWFVSAKQVKEYLIKEGYFKEECTRCGYNHRRTLDMKVPLLIFFKDLNKRNLMLENLSFLCYNCYFESVGDVFEQAQIKVMEDYYTVRSKDIDWDLPANEKKKYDDMMHGVYKQEFNKEEEVPEEINRDIILPTEVKQEEEEKPDTDYDDDFGLDLVSFLKK